jgi:pSer/pThr/pTyr-binding forkhead associated (FHA) protein
MIYRLRYQQHDFELSEGHFTIGRSTNCQLSLDDPLVSRLHARLSVTPEGVLVEDLGSRNGVRVNGDKLDQPRLLEHGDKVAIGNQEMVLLLRREATADTIVQAPPTQRLHSFGLIATLADKALALGRGEEAERLLSAQLQQVQHDLGAGHAAPTDVLEKAAQYAAKLAGATGKGVWVDYIVRIYTETRQPLPASIIDELYSVLRKVKQPDLRALRGYLEALRERSKEFSPAERFLVSRIEGLERLAAAK